MGLIGKIINEEIQSAQKIVEWPESYVHRQSNKVYTPHNESEYKFVYEDSPRFSLILGGEGCLSARTLLKGVPMGEWAGGNLDTLYGSLPSTNAFIKGRADLYQIKTKLGKVVEGTLDHRFLSPDGWLKLHDLNVGGLIATAGEGQNKQLESPLRTDIRYKWEQVYKHRKYTDFDWSFIKEFFSHFMDSLLDNGSSEGMWDEIDSISFTKHSEYYDLTVPVGEHYLANGIYHKNSGKSVALIIKILNRLKRGCNGAVISPNMPSFRRSLFPELLNWLPRSVVIDNHQRFFTPGWRPRESFIIVVHNELGGYSELMCASSESPRLLEGPNLNFAAMDEIRGMPDSEVLKVLAGRCRINGKNGEPFQLFCSSTPAMHWMFEMFGPPKEDDPEEIKDFKSQTYVARISVQENIAAGNIPEGFIESRGSMLTEAEKRVRIHGEWANEDNPDRFVPDMLVWDNLYDPRLTPVRPKTDSNRNWSDSMLLAIDASVSRDYTALVGVTRDPNNRNNVAVRLVRVWKPPKDGMIDFLEVQKYITDICKRNNVIMLVYDSFQMEQMAQTLYRGGVVSVKRFSQQAPRTIADQYLFDSIHMGSISHMGDAELRSHLSNADIQIDATEHKKRIVKRSKGMKIDAAVALSMANYECRRLNI